MERPLNSIEKFNVCRNLNGTYSNFAITGHYTQSIDRNLLANGLKELIGKFPKFQCRVLKKYHDEDEEKNNYKNYVLGSVDKIDFDDVVIKFDKPFNVNLFESINEIVCPVNTDKPVWRVLWFNDNTLTFLNDHSLMDGQSGGNFHDEMCKIFSKLPKDCEFVERLYTKSEFVVPSDTNDTTDLYKYSYWDLTKFLFWDNLPNFIKEWYNFRNIEYYPDTSKFPLIETPHAKVIKSIFKNLVIPNDKFAELSKILKFNGVSFTSFLEVFLNYCFQNTILPQLTSNPSSIKTSIPISGRRYFPISDDFKFNYMVTAIDIILPPITKMEVNWFHIMKAVGKNMNAELESRWMFKVFGLIDLVNIYDFVKPTIEGPGSTLIEISNLGYNKFTYGDWSVDDLCFSQCVGASTTFGFSVASTPKQMNITIGYPEKYENVPIDTFIEFFYDHLDIFIGNNTLE